MNALYVTFSIVAAIAAVIGVYIAARSNAREAERQRAAAVDRAVAAATAPLQADLAETRAALAEAQRTIHVRERRIERLEDELRRPRP